MFEIPVESCSGLDMSLVECKAVVLVGNVKCCLVLGWCLYTYQGCRFAMHGTSLPVKVGGWNKLKGVSLFRVHVGMGRGRVNWEAEMVPLDWPQINGSFGQSLRQEWMEKLWINEEGAMGPLVSYWS